jgi:opacity protein-like surface antigen
MEILMRKLMFSLALASICGLAQAADNGFYLGAGVTQAKLDNVGKDFSTSNLNDFKLDNTAWKLIAGFRPIDLFAVEANYEDLGNESRNLGTISVDADAKAFAAYAVAFLPIPIVDVYAKAGLARWEVNARSRGAVGFIPGQPLFSLDDKGTDFAYGAGVQLHFGSLAARLEYEQFDVKHTDGVELLTLGATWTFL